VDSVLPETRPTSAAAPKWDKDAIVNWLRKKVDGFSANDEAGLEELEVFEALTHIVANSNNSPASTTGQRHRQEIMTETYPSVNNNDDTQVVATAETSDDKIDRLETEVGELKAFMSEFTAWKEDFERKLFPKSSTAAPVWPKFGETPSESFRKQHNLPPGMVVYAGPDGIPMYRDDTRNADGTLKYIDRCWPLTRAPI